jgi:hypothetical protein
MKEWVMVVRVLLSLLLTSLQCVTSKNPNMFFLSDRRRTTYSFRDLERVGDSFMLPPRNLVEKAAKVAEASTTA